MDGSRQLAELLEACETVPDLRGLSHASAILELGRHFEDVRVKAVAVRETLGLSVDPLSASPVL